MTLHRNRNGFTLAELAVVVVLVGLIAFFLTSLSHTHPINYRRRCAANLKQIGLGIALYQQKHEDRLPPLGRDELFRTLYAEGILVDRHVYICLQSDDRPAEDDSGRLVCSYETWTAGEVTSEEIARHGGRTPLAWDRLDEHHEDVRQVLFLDGHVQEVDVRDFEPMLEEAGPTVGLER